MTFRSNLLLAAGLSVLSMLGAGTAFAADGFKVPGTSFVIKPYVETEGGYDTNPDNFVDKTGSSFGKIEGGLKVESDVGGRYYGLTLKAKDVYFENLDLQNRWDFKALLDTSFELTDTQTLKLGAGYYRDFFNLERADIYTSYADYTLKGQEFRFKLEAKNHTEKNLNNEPLGNEDPDVFNISKSEAFDYARTDGKVSLLAFTKSFLQPFVIYDYAGLNYFNQVTGASIDRDAREQFGIAGVRFRFSEDFRIDLGARHNNRDFEDRNIDKFSSTFVDLNVFWQPTDAIKITTIVERFIEEPGTSFGLADDTRTAGVTFDWDFMPMWQFKAAGYYDRVEAIGDDLRYNKYVTNLSITYEPNDHVEYFLTGLGKWVDEEVTGDSYDRYKVGLGMRYSF
jgi:hypothetical protein